MMAPGLLKGEGPKSPPVYCWRMVFVNRSLTVFCLPVDCIRSRARKVVEDFTSKGYRTLGAARTSEDGGLNITFISRFVHLRLYKSR